MKKIYLVIPSYNEGKRLTQVVKKIRDQSSKIPIIIVDDGSRIPVRFQDSQVTVLRHQLNLGKGAAMKTGAEYAFKQAHADAILFMDADGQHSPQEIPRFLKPLKEGYDLVLGSRRPSLDAPLIRLLGNKFASIYLNLVFGVYVTDILSGYRALNHQAYQAVKWSSQGYGVETEMIARLGKNQAKLKYLEIPIDTIYIDKYKGVTIMDALQILINSIWWKLT